MEQGGIIEIDMPIDASNVAVISPDGKPTRVGTGSTPTATKTRICKRTGADL
jgi:ribosomal protein L24